MKSRVMGALIAVFASCAWAQMPVEVTAIGSNDYATKDRPVEMTMRRASSQSIDLRKLPQTRPQKFERPEHEDPDPNPVELPGAPASSTPVGPPISAAPAPAPSLNFDGLDFATWGAGHPPDTNGDVGPVYYIQTINTSVGVFRKSDQSRVAAFTFNTLMSQGHFGNLCDTNNFGDPVVLYDSFEDRWVITDFAFQLDGSGNVINPPGTFQCFAVSKNGDPVTGGWNFYSVPIAGGLGDYPKFGVWTDGIYMSVNMFGYPAGASFQNPRVFALNKMQMYAGNSTVQIISFDAPAGDFTVIPSNARLQTGTPPPGTPAYFVSTWQFVNALSVYQFHVDWTRIGNSTFTGPSTPLASTSWPNASVPNAPSLGGNSLDVLQIRAMVQNQYTNIGGVESLWTAHTVRRQNTSGFAASRWYQTDVSGGTVAANLVQASTYDPDGANTNYRFVPSLGIDRAGDLAMTYTESSSTTKPSLMYAGRLAADPVNAFSQSEQLLMQGTGTQSGNCGSSSCIRWGDYSAMTLDPDGCTFWFTGEYYATDGLSFLTRIGTFSYPSCTPSGAGGTLSGTVTLAPGGAPIAGATVMLGSRATTTDGSGSYSFAALPAGTYPVASASAPACSTASATSLVITDGNTTAQNFSLSSAPGSACLTDTTQADFQTGVGTNVDLNGSPGDVTLFKGDIADQQNTSVGNSGVGITTTTWGGQTFKPSVSGQLTHADINLFCSGCTGTTPNLTLSVRATSGGLPTGADLAAGTVTGFSNGSSAFYTATFSPPPAVSAGTQYALVIRPTANPSPGTYALTRSGTSTAGSDVYAGGTRVSGATSGTVWSIPLTGGVSTDAGFHVYINAGYSTTGDLISAVKDANPASNETVTWTSLSWDAAIPANTGLQFQVAGSNSSAGPFNFVGPDNTAGTFFTSSGAPLSQFNGQRYLKYRAYLSTSDTTTTPTLNDVTMCFADFGPNLAITVDDGVTTATAGNSVTYTITASNPGSTDETSSSTVTDAFPAGETCTWTCTGANGGTCTGSGSGNINDLVNLPAGSSVAYTASCAIASSATGTLSNTATVTAPASAVDSDTSNNSATDTDVLTAQADLAITKTDGVTTATPGGATTYTITASNSGPSDAPGADVADTFPASLTCTWTCVGAGGATCTASGSGNINDTTNLLAGSSVTYTASCSIASSATGSLSNTATVVAPAGVTDPTPGNNSATDTDALSAQADLAITNTDGVTSVMPGNSTTYTIAASNSGPSDAPGSVVADTFPAALTCTWTCVGAGGGTCTASGSGNINDTTNLPSGASVIYTASCAVANNAIGTLSNTATVSAASGITDPAPGNNSATDSDTVSPIADVAVSLYDDHRTYVQLNDTLDYIIFITNTNGPSTATATVTDVLPPQLTGGVWNCIPSVGATCASGVGDTLTDTVTLPSGGFVAYVYSTGVVGYDANEQITNSVSVNAIGDPNTANNSASDTDIVVIFRDDFEGTPKNLQRVNSAPDGLASGNLRVDSGLLAGLTIAPVVVATGVDAAGDTLFTLEIARFGNDVVVRSLIANRGAPATPTGWQKLDSTPPPLLTFAWQAAMPTGFISLDVGGSVAISAHTDKQTLAALWITIENNVPWLVLIAP